MNDELREFIKNIKWDCCSVYCDDCEYEDNCEPFPGSRPICQKEIDYLAKQLQPYIDREVEEAKEESFRNGINHSEKI